MKTAKSLRFTGRPTWPTWTVPLASMHTCTQVRIHVCKRTHYTYAPHTHTHTPVYNIRQEYSFDSCQSTRLSDRILIELASYISFTLIWMYKIHQSDTTPQVSSAHYLFRQWRILDREDISFCIGQFQEVGTAHTGGPSLGHRHSSTPTL